MALTADAAGAGAGGVGRVVTPTLRRIDASSRIWTLATAGLSLLPLLLQLPGLLALAIAAAGVLVAALSWRRPMPAWVRVLLAVAVVGVVLSQMGLRLGRDTGCALLAAMLAIKPSETATVRDARSLVGFALFAPFAAFLLDQGPLTMLLGVVAVLCALVALQRLADVEAQVPPRANTRTGTLGATVRLVAIGLPLALAAFWLFPRLASPLWGVPERSVARPGLSDTMSPGEWLDLMSDDRPALRVQFFGPVPAPHEMYWRGPVLWDYDGRTWSQPRWMRGIPAQPFTPGPARWDYQMSIEPTDRTQLVALELPLAAPEGTMLSHDYGLYAQRPLTGLSRWRVQSAPPARFEDPLRTSMRQRALALPEGYNPRTVALARQWRSEAGSDDAAIVARAMAWITQEFGYTLNTPLPGRHPVDEFLFDQQQGFCEHFSSAFVVLMRAAGIPSRVVTGYVGGYRNPFGGYWVVRRMDAHAWAEVWLEGRGWVRADPTAAVAPERIYDTLEDRANFGGDGFGQLAAIGDFGDWMRRGWNDLVLGFDAERQQRMLQPLGIDRLDGSRLGLLFGLFALFTLGWMAWLLARGERQRDRLLRAWHRMDRRYRRLGLARAAHEGPLDWAERVAAARPDQGDALRLLSVRFAAARYAGDLGDAGLVGDLRRHRP